MFYSFVNDKLKKTRFKIQDLDRTNITPKKGQTKTTFGIKNRRCLSKVTQKWDDVTLSTLPLF